MAKTETNTALVPPAPVQPITNGPPAQQLTQVALVPVPQGLPSVTIAIYGISIQSVAPTIGEAVQASEFMLSKVRTLLWKNGYDYI